MKKKMLVKRGILKYEIIMTKSPHFIEILKWFKNMFLLIGKHSICALVHSKPHCYELKPYNNNNHSLVVDSRREIILYI